jgi:hypothetical protein
MNCNKTFAKNNMNCNKMTITEIIESRKTSTEWLVPNPTVFPEKGFPTIPKNSLTTAIKDVFYRH